MEVGMNELEVSKCQRGGLKDRRHGLYTILEAEEMSRASRARREAETERHRPSPGPDDDSLGVDDTVKAVSAATPSEMPARWLERPRREKQRGGLKDRGPWSALDALEERGLPAESAMRIMMAGVSLQDLMDVNGVVCPLW